LYEAVGHTGDIVVGSTLFVGKSYRGFFPERVVQNPHAEWPMTCNIAYRRRIFEDCGGFDPYFDSFTNEDTEMALRAISRGYSIARNQGALVFHEQQFWSRTSLIRSAKNASVWAVLKKRYPKQCTSLGGPAKRGWIVDPFDYLLIMLVPFAFPVLFIRYWMHGGRDVWLYILKYPIWFWAKRLHIYYQAIKNRVFIL
jgi:GT2 family glycosyltransferase